MNRTKIEFNNYDEVKNIVDTNLILKALETSDEYLIEKLHSLITPKYQTKINLINYVLDNKIKKNTFKTVEDIIYFFNILSPLSNIYDFGSFKYNFKTENNYLFVQNSVPKEYKNDDFDDFIELLNDHFDNLDFHFYDLNDKRFNKTLDFIFVFKINGETLIKKIEK
jgi:hypothetical protein